MKELDKLPREGVISLSEEEADKRYFGAGRIIFWREFRSLVVALIGESDSSNLAVQSVLITFILKEVQRMKDAERKEASKLKREGQTEERK